MNTIVREYSSWRNDCRDMTEASAMLDAIHAEARTCVDNLADMAQRAIDRGDLDGAMQMLGELRRHEAVRDWVESLVKTEDPAG